MALYTLEFPNYETAKTAATELGFWDPELDQLKTDGQSVDVETGETFGWNITYCGHRVITPGDDETPPVMSSDVYAIVTGHLPAGAMSYLAPYYGYSGHFFSGETEPIPHPENGV